MVGRLELRWLVEQRIYKELNSQEPITGIDVAVDIHSRRPSQATTTLA
jgi:hypothetical protein